MKWRRMAVLGIGTCQKCGKQYDRNMLEIKTAIGTTKVRMYCDLCMYDLGVSEGDPRR